MFKKLIFLACLVLGLLGNASADLIVHWTLEEGSGTTATDVSGNSRDGTFTGEPQWVSGHNSAGALHFDGVDDFVVYSLDGAQNFATISVALWVKADTLGQPVYCSPFSAHYPNTAGFQVDVDGQNPGAYRINPNSGNRFAFGPVTTDWIHLALTIEGSSMNLYYNGNWASSNTLVDTDLTFNQFAIGVNRNRNWWFAGAIDDLRVYDHVLSEVEVVSIMEGKPWPFASSPKPEDASMLEATWASLSWQGGQLAVSHDLYFGTNFDDVNAGAEGTFVGNLATTQQVVGFPGFPAPEGLQPGTIYYWRVDEVNHADPNSPWKGNIWSFAVPPRIAYDPRPSDGAKFADPNVELTWTPGFDAKLHTAYFGDNFDDVNGATGGIPLADATYVPGTLELEKVYYWRVDEFDGAQTHKGDVWRFTTTRSGGGLKAEYFNNALLTGEPVVTRLDPGIDFNWGNADVPGENSPDASINVNYFGGRWTGELEVDLTDSYTFGINANNGFRLWLDGRRIIDYWTNPTTSSRQSDPIELLGGETYSIRMDYFEGEDVAIAQLFWQNSTREEQIIPSGALQPPSRAGDPSPYNGATGVTQVATPTWRPSETAASHQVYFGTDAEAVTNATTASPEYKGSKALGDETLDPGKLAWQTTYYWRVDEVDSANNTTVGKVWSFTIAGFLPVDDFETYNDIDLPDPASKTIFASWADGFQIPTNGALTANDMPPYAEQSTVHTGFQSMPYRYDTNMMICESTLTLTYPKDWTEEGVTKLSLWFRGNSGNAAERMFVALNGTAVVYHDDPAASQMTGWNEWVIDLAGFAGVDLTNVNAMTIGFGTKNVPAAGGQGTVYFDDIVLIR